MKRKRERENGREKNIGRREKEEGRVLEERERKREDEREREEMRKSKRGRERRKRGDSNEKISYTSIFSEIFSLNFSPSRFSEKRCNSYKNSEQKNMKSFSDFSKITG